MSKRPMRSRVPWTLLNGTILVLAGLGLRIGWLYWFESDVSTGYWRYEGPAGFIPWTALLIVAAGVAMICLAVRSYLEERYWKTILLAQPGPAKAQLVMEHGSGSAEVNASSKPAKLPFIERVPWLGLGFFVLGTSAFWGVRGWLLRHSFADDAWDQDFALLLLGSLMMFAAAGISLMAIFVLARIRSQSEQPFIFRLAGSAGQFFQWGRRQPLRKSFSGLPTFGWTAAAVFAILVALMMMLELGFRRHSIGLNVHLLKPGAVPAVRDYGKPPVVLHLALPDGPGRTPQAYLNSQAVAWESLAGVVSESLKARPDRIVYIEADEELQYRDVVSAVDAVRSAQAEVVLLTPEKRGVIQRQRRAPR